MRDSRTGVTRVEVPRVGTDVRVTAATMVSEMPHLSTLEAQQDGPIEELLAFHVVIRAQLDELDVVVGQLERGRVDEARVQKLRAFFAGPLLWHDEDEEVSVLPRLRRAIVTSSTHNAIERIHRGHDRMETLLEEIDDALARAPARREDDVRACAKIAASLRSLLTAHLELEEKELFPLCNGVLQPEELATIADEMAARHGRRAAGTRTRRAVEL